MRPWSDRGESCRFSLTSLASTCADLSSPCLSVRLTPVRGCRCRVNDSAHPATLVGDFTPGTARARARADLITRVPKSRTRTRDARAFRTVVPAPPKYLQALRGTRAKCVIRARYSPTPLAHSAPSLPLCLSRVEVRRSRGPLSRTWKCAFRSSPVQRNARVCRKIFKCYLPKTAGRCCNCYLVD